MSGLTIENGVASFSIYCKDLTEAKRRNFTPAMGAPISMDDMEVDSGGTASGSDHETMRRAAQHCMDLRVLGPRC